MPVLTDSTKEVVSTLLNTHYFIPFLFARRFWKSLQFLELQIRTPMDQTHVLFGLPNVILLELLHKWLNLKCVARLDSATCKNTLRSTLLDAVRFDVYYNNPPVAKQLDAFYSWTFARNIRLVIVVLDEALPYAKVAEVLSANSICIRRVNLLNRTDASAILSDISYYCKQLEIIKIAGCLVAGALRSVLLHCQKITSVYLSRANQPSDINENTFEGVSCLNTTTIVLPSTVNDATMNAVVLGFPAIQRLQLNHNENITNKTVVAIANGYSGLTSVGFYKNHLITDEAMSLLYKSCPGLVAVDVGKCVSLSDRSFISLATHCTNLRRLGMRINPRVTDKSLVAIANSCKALNLLSCEGSRRITNVGIIAIATGCPNMRVFYFGHRKAVSKSAAIAVAEHCTKLVELSILDMVVSGDLLTKIAESCGSRMKRLYFVHCYSSDPELHSVVLAQRAAHPKIDINMDAPEFRMNIVTHDSFDM